MTAAAARKGAPNYQAQEIGLAALMAVAAWMCGWAGLSFTDLSKTAKAPDVVPVQAIPMKVTPVLDLDAPTLKLGGKRVRAKLPDRWLRQAPVKRVERKAYASTKAKDDVKSIPAKETKVATVDAGPPPPADAAIAKQVDEPVTESSDAGPANVDTEGHADGTKDGTETDPLKARAVNLYANRIRAWFAGRFVVKGSGMSPDELKKYRPGATISLSPDGTVLSYTLRSSGNAVFDAAAKRALDSTVGQSIPPPPENYPDLKKNSIGVTFVCNAQRCS